MDTFSETPNVPILPVKLRKVAKRKRATAQIRGAAIEIVMPQHWSKAFQTDVTHQLSKQLQRQFDRDHQLLSADDSLLMTFEDKKVFEAWVRELNDRTFRVPLEGVRIGHARYTHLAQMNLRTHVMTVSKYCLRYVPEPALKYLVLHELAHLKVPNHSKAFWDEVRRFIPDFKHQRRLITAVHRIRIYEADLQLKNQLSPLVSIPLVPQQKTFPEKEGLLKQLFLKFF